MQERRSAAAIFLVQQYIQEHLGDDLSLTLQTKCISIRSIFPDSFTK
ncbi:hypothetical protein JOC55_005739 [Paenibacillus sacheonensis]|nr:hypothetical protein [Paenibacillus sacheonensis]